MYNLWRQVFSGYLSLIVRTGSIGKRFPQQLIVLGYLIVRPNDGSDYRLFMLKRPHSRQFLVVLYCFVSKTCILLLSHLTYTRKYSRFRISACSKRVSRGFQERLLIFFRD